LRQTQNALLKGKSYIFHSTWFFPKILWQHCYGTSFTWRR